MINDDLMTDYDEVILTIKVYLLIISITVQTLINCFNFKISDQVRSIVLEIDHH
jgi:hypothetical protein